MLRIAVHDDEKHALERFETIAANFEEIALCRLFDDADDLLKEMNLAPFDVVFLDIEMPGTSGIQLAEELHNLTPGLTLIFVTAYSQYAVEAFELNVSDYILKPVTVERLRKTLDRIRPALPPAAAEKKVTIHCFPRFECTVDDNPVPLNHLMKSKELLAFLVSRKGAETSWEQITEALWPDTDYERAHNNLYITTYRLRKWLAENNLFQIFESRRNSYRVVPSAFRCDLYELDEALKTCDETRIRHLYRGDFLEEDGYQWAYPIQAEWAMKLGESRLVRVW